MTTHFHINIDEVGQAVVQSKHPKILTLKGKRQTGAVTACERGCLITFVVSLSAASGVFILPLVIFLLTKFKPPSHQIFSSRHYL
jgi:hypothetical protein